MKRIVCCAALVAVTLTLGVACTAKRAPGEAALTLTGRARLTSASGKITTVFRDLTVRRGQTIRVTQGVATLQFSGGRRIELRQGGALKVDRTPSVVSGEVLLEAAATKFTVRAAGSTIALTNAAARVNRGLALETAAYRGTINLVSAGHALAVPALRQATIPSLGVVPNKAEPLRLRSTDAWDRRFLGDAIELTEELQTSSDGLTGQVRAGQGQSAGFLTTLIPALEREVGFGASLIDPARKPGETVVGASIAVASRTAGFADRWRAVFGFRDEGAAWGLVALDQQVTDAPALSSTVDAALARVHSLATETAAAPMPRPTAPTATTPATSTPSGPSNPPTTAPAPDPTPAPSPVPPTTLPPAPGVLTPVLDVVGGLLSGLRP